MRVHRPTAILLALTILAIVATPWFLADPIVMLIAAGVTMLGSVTIGVIRLRREHPILICLECTRCHVPYDVAAERIRCVECGLEVPRERFIDLARRATEAHTRRIRSRLSWPVTLLTITAMLADAVLLFLFDQSWSIMFVLMSVLPATMLAAGTADVWLTRPHPPDRTELDRLLAADSDPPTPAATPSP